MPRAKKEGTYLNIKLRQDLYDRLCEYCEESGMPKTSVTEKALDQYLRERLDDTATRTIGFQKEGGAL